MRVLLTGANGFVGSHVLDRLLDAGHEVSITLRTTSDTRFIEPRLGQVRVHYATLEDVDSLRPALGGAEAVIHCAGRTKAVRRREYEAVNVAGTGNLVTACNEVANSLRQLIYISSLAVSGPGTLERPAREDARPRPVSEYGRSKWRGELCVRRRSRAPWTALRPAAVYGPRDRDFYLAFRSVRSGVLPLVNGGRQPLSLVYGPDVAGGVLAALGEPRALGRVCHLAHPVPSTQRGLFREMARAMGGRPAEVFVPAPLLYPVCAAHHARSRLTGRPGILNLEKAREYAAPGWVCSTEAAREELGFVAPTSLEDGIARTLRWYEEAGWL